jgi:hypothetical protein
VDGEYVLLELIGLDKHYGEREREKAKERTRVKVRGCLPFQPS